LDKNADIFLSIIENHKGILYKIANSYCKDQEDRQDLIQEIIIQLWQSFENYNSQFKRSTWIYRIALNTAISFYRKNKVRRLKTTELSAILATSLKADEPFQDNPNLAILQVFIQELREIDKALILLYLDGLSQKEIAEIIGITPTNVGTKLSRIKKTLRQKFQTINE
jgi:RNA polymerase sigma-70 factor (ECF subfamily)